MCNEIIFFLKSLKNNLLIKALISTNPIDIVYVNVYPSDTYIFYILCTFRWFHGYIYNTKRQKFPGWGKGSTRHLGFRLVAITLCAVISISLK